MANNPTQQLPLLPLRDLIIFPHMMMPLFVGREKSINALEDAMSKQTDIVLAAQKDAKTNKFNPPPLKAWDDPEFIKTADIAVFNNKSTYNIEIQNIFIYYSQSIY